MQNGQGKIIRLETVDSTNAYLNRAGHEGAPAWTVCVAEEQTAGRGRLDRNWNSPRGQGLWMSILIRPAVKIEDTGLLSFCAALAVSDTLQSVCGIHAEIKWPNDLVCNGKKICGILSTCSLLADGTFFNVVGIGVNTHRKAYPEEIKDRSTSIEDENGDPDREAMITCCLERLQYYTGLLEEGRKEELIPMTSRRCVTLGKIVRVTGATEATGTAEQIGPDGELILLTGNGERVSVRCGDVSVRGVMGYA